jgi:hypothetical protein
MMDFRKLKTGDFLEIDEHGTIRVKNPVLPRGASSVEKAI